MTESECSKKSKTESSRPQPREMKHRKTQLVVNIGNLADREKGLLLKTRLSLTPTLSPIKLLMSSSKKEPLSSGRAPGHPQIRMSNLSKLRSNSEVNPDQIIAAKFRLPPLYYSPSLPPVSKPTKVRISGLSCVSTIGVSTKRVKTDNQDAFLSISAYCGSARANLFAVFDGHGADGHLISDFLRETFPKALSQSVRDFLCGLKTVSELIEDIKKTFLAVHEDLCKTLPFDADSSGSTAVLILLIDDHLFCANVGDSRAVLGSKSQSWRLTSLTHDHRPDSPEENARILLMRGRVEQNHYPDNEVFGPMRVWLPNKNAPGLAMSRSLGDFVVHEYGVTAEPDVVYRQLRESDRILLLASDGVWNFMENSEALHIASRFYPKREADLCSERLAQEATRRWKEEGENVDDITIITAFIN